MRKSITGIAAAIASVVVAIGFLVVPAASAYQTPTTTPNPCAESDTAPETGCAPVVCSALGGVQIDEYNCRFDVPVEPLPTPVPVDPTPTPRPTPTPTPEDDEIQGVSLTPPLATTGSNIDTPITLGALLIGVGGIVLFAARSRQDRIDSE